MPDLPSLSLTNQALIDFVNGKEINAALLDGLVRSGLVCLTPALTLAGTEAAEAAGWRRPAWED
jgi:hypothetical protein